MYIFYLFFSSRRRHTRSDRDWSSDVCSSDLKEMGLVDEAIAEFQLAAKDENRILECSSMLGICFLEKGMPKLAIKWFEKGLAASGRSEEEYQGLRYDLACALESAGETDRALSV